MENQVQKNKFKLSQTLGIVALIVGILTLIFSFIPCFGTYAIYPGLICIGLSIWGFIDANKTGAAKGLLIAALTISIIASVIAFTQMYKLKQMEKQNRENYKNLPNMFR